MKLDTRQRQILVGMKSTLLTAGWRKNNLGVFENGKPSSDGVCLYGSLVAACGTLFAHPPTVCGFARRAEAGASLAFNLDDDPNAVQVAWALAAEAGVTLEKLAVWNDAEERTLDDVIDLIDRTLARAAREESNAARRARTRTAV